MIKLLQRKFIFTSMIAITVLILFMLGAINVANILWVKNDANTRLHMIAKKNGNPMDLQGNPRELPRFNDKMQPRLEGDRIQTTPFFTVNFDENERIIFTDSSHIPSLTKTDVEAYAKQVLHEKKESGEIGNYKYLVNQDERIPGKSITFLDTSDEFYFYIRVMGISIVIGVICWICMLVLVCFLSKMAIRPIAENMEKQKQFITNAGHEIKTPLAIIQTNAEALELYQGESKWSNNIKQQTTRLSDLMKNLLQLSRMDESDVVVKKEEINLSHLLSEEISFFEEMFAQNGLRVERNLPQKPEMIEGNKEQIKQMITILLENVCKYAKKETMVSIVFVKTGRHIQIWIENECEELPSEEPERLFERFYRADQARTQKNGGYGIGLSLAKAIAEANKYTLECSYLENQRIRFTIAFF